MVLIIIFWLSFFLVAYHLFLYPVLLWVINGFKVKHNTIPATVQQSSLPTITVLCPAFNEEAVIKEKIESFIALDYPKDKIKMIVLSDDSTDNTNAIVQQFHEPNIELVIQKPRGGKQRAHNLIQPSITTDYVLSTDANTIFNPDCVLNLVSAIQSVPNIGIVSGELKLVKRESNDSGEGLYWKYESFLKKQDSDFYSIIGANGSIFLIRRELFTQVDPASVDDFERTLYVLSKGFLAKYAPDANGFEDVTEIAMEEFSRKVRIITQEWFALRRNIGLLNPFKHLQISFLLISHKVIRWLLFLFAFLMLISSLLISTSFYLIIFYAQILFYIVGYLELTLQKSGKRIPMAGIVAYFTTMCWASLIAFIKFIFNKNIGIWNPVRKQESK